MSRLVLALLLAAAPSSTAGASAPVDAGELAVIAAAPHAVPVGEVVRASLELPAQPAARVVPLCTVSVAAGACPSPVRDRRRPSHRTVTRRRVPRMGTDEPPAR